MGVGAILLGSLLLLLVAVNPAWPYSRDWDYFPSLLVALALIGAAMLTIAGLIGW